MEIKVKPNRGRVKYTQLIKSIKKHLSINKTSHDTRTTRLF
jgi:hypothetical protein